MSVNFKVLQPIIATPKGARATITIPTGAIVEIGTALSKGGITEVLWEGECFSAQIHDVLGACTIVELKKKWFLGSSERGNGR